MSDYYLCLDTGSSYLFKSWRLTYAQVIAAIAKIPDLHHYAIAQELGNRMIFAPVVQWRDKVIE